jgi:acylphosphatase
VRLSRKKPAPPVARGGFVSGRVQSVAFRFYARQEATQLQLQGWVKNLPDGRVAFHVQGPGPAVSEFLEWIQVGPPLAKVEHLQADPVELEALDGFEIH